MNTDDDDTILISKAQLEECQRVRVELTEALSANIGLTRRLADAHVELATTRIERDEARAALEKIANTTGRNGHTATRLVEFARAALASAKGA